MQHQLSTLAVTQERRQGGNNKDLQNVGCKFAWGNRAFGIRTSGRKGGIKTGCEVKWIAFTQDGLHCENICSITRDHFLISGIDLSVVD